MRAAVLGTGIMGAAMARSLAREGHEVAVWNRTPERADAVATRGHPAYGGVRRPSTEPTSSSRCSSTQQRAGRGRRGGRRARHGRGLACSRARSDPTAWHASPPPSPRPPAGSSTPPCSAPASRPRTAPVVLSGPGPAPARVASAVDAIGRGRWSSATRGPASALKLVCNSWVATICAAIGQATGLASVLGLDPGCSGHRWSARRHAHASKGAAMMTGTYTPRRSRSTA